MKENRGEGQDCIKISERNRSREENTKRKTRAGMKVKNVSLTRPRVKP